VDLSHYRNARARANQVKPVTDSISAEALQKKASSHLEGHVGVLKQSKEKKQEVEMPEDTIVLDQETKDVQNPPDDGEVKALEVQNKELEQRVLALERERHGMLVEKHITAAQKRGIAPVIVKLVRPVMEACYEEAERIIVLEAEGDKPEAKANIFEMMVRLLEECPTKLGEVTVGPEGKKLEEKSEGDQTVTARLKKLEDAMKRQYKELKAQGWPDLVAPPGVED